MQAHRRRRSIPSHGCSARARRGARRWLAGQRRHGRRCRRPAMVTRATRPLPKRRSGAGRSASPAIRPRPPIRWIPRKQTLSTDYARCNMFYNGLTTLDGNLTPQPALAESFENDDATSGPSSCARA